ncbi:MAG: PaaI family thioesterase [Bdellovibrionales bacterium]|nr:PaaI family thioesterase [Bdellovibrionales bacterium]
MSIMSLQDEFAPRSICFGCGPSNPKGLRIKSFVENDGVYCRWQPEAHHEAFPGMLNGGIIGAILDCHSNWTAAWQLMKNNSLDQPPCTVTAEYSIQLKRPTPSDQVQELWAKVVEAGQRRVVVEAELKVAGEICATCRGTFVAVKPGHPAFHRWS